MGYKANSSHSLNLLFLFPLSFDQKDCLSFLQQKSKHVSALVPCRRRRLIGSPAPSTSFQGLLPRGTTGRDIYRLPEAPKQGKGPTTSRRKFSISLLRYIAIKHTRVLGLGADTFYVLQQEEEAARADPVGAKLANIARLNAARARADRALARFLMFEAHLQYLQVVHTSS